MLKSYRKNAQTILVKQATTHTLKILKIFKLPNPLAHLPIVESLVKGPVPNTVEPEACCVQDGQTYVLLEHLPTFNTIRSIKIKQEEFDFDEKIVSDMVSQILKAISGLHGRGILHGSVDLDHVLCSEEVPNRTKTIYRLVGVEQSLQAPCDRKYFNQASLQVESHFLAPEMFSSDSFD